MDSLKKNIFTGAITGFLTAVIISALAIINRGGIEMLQTVLEFFASVPVYISMVSGLSRAACIILFFIYWIIIGVIGGIISGSGPALRNILFIALTVIIVISHASIQKTVNREMTVIAEAAGRLLSHLFGGNINK